MNDRIRLLAHIGRLRSFTVQELVQCTQLDADTIQPVIDSLREMGLSQRMERGSSQANHLPVFDLSNEGLQAVKKEINAAIHQARARREKTAGRARHLDAGIIPTGLLAAERLIAMAAKSGTPKVAVSLLDQAEGNLRWAEKELLSGVFRARSVLSKQIEKYRRSVAQLKEAALRGRRLERPETAISRESQVSQSPPAFGDYREFARWLLERLGQGVAAPHAIHSLSPLAAFVEERRSGPHARGFEQILKRGIAAAVNEWIEEVHGGFDGLLELLRLVVRTRSTEALHRIEELAMEYAAQAGRQEDAEAIARTLTAFESLPETAPFFETILQDPRFSSMVPASFLVVARHSPHELQWHCERVVEIIDTLGGPFSQEGKAFAARIRETAPLHSLVESACAVAPPVGIRFLEAAHYGIPSRMAELPVDGAPQNNLVLADLKARPLLRVVLHSKDPQIISGYKGMVECQSTRDEPPPIAQVATSFLASLNVQSAAARYN